MTRGVVQALARPWGGRGELGFAVALYAVYEVVRGFGSTSIELARDHAAAIVALEQRLGVFFERSVQEAVEQVPALPGLLGFLYMSLHLCGTTAALIWVYRRHREHFPLVRTTIVAGTAISLAVYVLYPAAPPRLAGLGFVDTVASAAHVNLSSEALGSLYNPFAAVPSLHFGYALLVGAAIASLGGSRLARAAGLFYPLLMLFVIVATGNHFLFDAAAGALVMAAAWLVARRVAGPRLATKTA
jgi:PAP2 superfamily protein